MTAGITFAPSGAAAPPRMGVAIVTYNAASFITDCLASALASQGIELRIVVVDNDSDDGTCDVVRAWASAKGVSFVEARVGDIDRASATLTLLRSPVNGGFAHGTNRGLEILLADPGLDLFWLLNPDCRVLPDTAAIYAHAAESRDFALMGGRTLYLEHPDIVQTDGGRVSRATGLCRSVNLGVPSSEAPMPDAASLDFITGANCVASRRFIEQTGLMREGYFLYYEEVDWAFRRGELPLRVVPEAVILHRGGAAIGSGAHNRRSSAFANFFNYRNRMRFLRRFHPLALPGALLHAAAKAAQLLLLGAREEAAAVLAGATGLPPPRAVRERLDPAARKLAFGQAPE